jgi:hypothetical protein
MAAFDKERQEALLKQAELDWFKHVKTKYHLEALNYEFARCFKDIRDDVESLRNGQTLRPNYGYSRYLLTTYAESFPSQPWNKTSSEAAAVLARHFPDHCDDVPDVTFFVYPSDCFIAREKPEGAIYFKFFPRVTAKSQVMDTAREFAEWYEAAAASKGRDIPIPFFIDWAELTAGEQSKFHLMPFSFDLKPETASRRFRKWYRMCTKKACSENVSVSSSKNPVRHKKKGKGSPESTLLTCISDLAALRSSYLRDREFDPYNRNDRRKKKNALLLLLRFIEAWRGSNAPVNPFGSFGTHMVGVRLNRIVWNSSARKTPEGRTFRDQRDRQRDRESADLLDLENQVCWPA